jgi:beta-xylosidase
MYLWRDMKGGQMSRDMTVYVDDDGKAYHITSSQENLTLLVSELTDAYLDFTGKYNMVAPGGQNEAPCIFKHAGTYWLICSGCTGWSPNEARMSSAKSIWGPWTQHPSPFVGTAKGYRDMPANKTFGAQGTYITTLNGRLLFMADIWNPRHLAQSLHLWLPIGFDAQGTPVISWADSPF